MSFGFSVGDIIAVSRLAIKVYKGLHDAPDEYKRLASQVLSLKGILDLLDETRDTTTLQEADVERLAQVVRGCQDVLLRLEELIGKYEGIGKRRFSRIANYTGAALSDTTELQQTLSLQYSLVSNFQISLVNRGQARIGQALVSISRQIQQGQRPNSVLDSSVLENEDEEVEEIWHRIEQELEDEGIEKTALSNNKNFIFEWIQRALVAGELSEKRPELSEAGISSRPPSRNAEVTTREKLEALSLVINRPQADDKQPPQAVYPESDALLHKVATSGATSTTRVQANHSNDTLSSNQEKIYNLLLSLSIPDVRYNTREAAREESLKQAFLILDLKNEGSVLRHEVVNAWWPVLQAQAKQIQQAKLTAIVRSGDDDRDGLINLPEFLNLSEKIINGIANIHDARLNKSMESDRLSALANHRIALTNYRTRHRSPAILPWGWTENGGYFEDLVSGLRGKVLPYFGKVSLTVMAYFSAPLFVTRVQAFIVRYEALPGVGSGPGESILEAFLTLRKAALSFTHLESTSDGEDNSSDLANMFMECSILYESLSEHQLIEELLEALGNVVAFYQKLFNRLSSIMFTLNKVLPDTNNQSQIQSVELELMEAERFASMWASERMAARVRTVKLLLTQLDQIIEDVRTCRLWRAKNPELSVLALAAAKSMYKISDEKKRKRKEISQKINQTLYPDEAKVSLKVQSAVGLSAGTFRKGSPLHPFALLYFNDATGQTSQMSSIANTKSPNWQGDDWLECVLPLVQLKQIFVKVYESSNRQPIAKKKYEIGSSDIWAHDLLNVPYNYRHSKKIGSEFEIKKGSLLLPYDGTHTLYLTSGFRSAGRITLQVKWDGIVEQVRALKLPFDEYFESLPEAQYAYCEKIFPEEVKEFTKQAAERKNTQSLLTIDPSKTYLWQSPNWRVERGFRDPDNENVQMREGKDRVVFYVYTITKDWSYDPWTEKKTWIGDAMQG